MGGPDVSVQVTLKPSHMELMPDQIESILACKVGAVLEPRPMRDEPDPGRSNG